MKKVFKKVTAATMAGTMVDGVGAWLQACSMWW